MHLISFYPSAMEINQTCSVNFYQVNEENDIKDYVKIRANLIHLKNDLCHFHHNHYALLPYTKPDLLILHQNVYVGKDEKHYFLLENFYHLYTLLNLYR